VSGLVKGRRAVVATEPRAQREVARLAAADVAVYLAARLLEGNSRKMAGCWSLMAGEISTTLRCTSVKRATRQSSISALQTNM
jgi:hypothetical protein